MLRILGITKNCYEALMEEHFDSIAKHNDAIGMIELHTPVDIHTYPDHLEIYVKNWEYTITLSRADFWRIEIE